MLSGYLLEEFGTMFKALLYHEPVSPLAVAISQYIQVV